MDEHRHTREDRLPQFIILELDTTNKNKKEYLKYIDNAVENYLTSEVNKYRDNMNKEQTSKSIFEYIISITRASIEKEKMMKQFSTQVDLIYANK